MADLTGSDLQPYLASQQDAFARSKTGSTEPTPPRLCAPFQRQQAASVCEAIFIPRSDQGYEP
jgi:hypothetical protein